MIAIYPNMATTNTVNTVANRNMILYNLGNHNPFYSGRIQAQTPNPITMANITPIRIPLKISHPISIPTILRSRRSYL